jgi:hypothetical protein
MAGREKYADMSKAERKVAAHLNNWGFDWFYEHPLFVYDEKKRPRVWTPDFFLPALNIYIEVCGSENFDYSYREEIYKNNEIPVVFLPVYKENGFWQKHLLKTMFTIEEKRHSNAMGKLRKLMDY